MLTLVWPVAAAAQQGEALYAEHCASCHSDVVEHSPHITSLNAMSRRAFMAALDGGVMARQAAVLSGEDKEAIADFVVGSDDEADWDWRTMRCASEIGLAESGNRHWGSDLANSRHVSLPAVPEPALEWVFAYPNASRARSQPAFVDGVLFFGSEDGSVYAMDAQSPCIYWSWSAGVEVRTGITVIGDLGRSMLVFGDFMGRVHALDAKTGNHQWTVRPESHATATITAQPQYHDGVVYVAMSSREFLAGADPEYDCCTFRGSVIALDAKSGGTIWQRYVIAEEPRKIGNRPTGTAILAPSGAPIWGTPTIDPGRGQLYVGTGENYSRPATGTSDAIVAMSLASGEINWVRQTLADDAWNVACTPRYPDKSNCPTPRGPDLDFGAPPMLVAKARGEILVAGQKSGWVFGISPDDGTVIWSRRIGRGGGQGGVHFGMAAAGGKVFAPVFDSAASFGPDGDEFPPRPGMHALDAASGEILWSTLADDVCGGRRFCSPGISAPPTVLDDYVLAGHSDGRLQAYDAATGRIVWTYETDRDFESVNGLPAHGGSMGGGSGPVIADGTVFVNSGYSSLRHMPGNVLLALRISGR